MWYINERGKGHAVTCHKRTSGRGGQLHAPADLLLVKSLGTYCTGDWVVPKAGLDRYGEKKTFCSLRGSKPKSSSP